MARSVRTLLDTVVQALPEVGNLGLLFFLLFYIFAALGVELFGRIGEIWESWFDNWSIALREAAAGIQFRVLTLIFVCNVAIWQNCRLEDQ